MGFFEKFDKIYLYRLRKAENYWRNVVFALNTFPFE